MNFVNQIQLFKRLHSLILYKRTGTPKQFAKKLNISESTLYRIILDFKDYGVCISFDANRQSYIYENEKDINSILRLDDFEI